MKTVQIGIIGAMQRSHPALTQLWLRWTGIPDLDLASFNTVQPDETLKPASQITLHPTVNYQETQKSLCDLLGYPAKAAERDSSNLVITEKAPAHEKFWSTLVRREKEDVEGPLEWWWRLLIMRQRGLRPASRLLLTSLFGDDDLFTQSVVRFDNPSLKTEGRRSSEVIENGYLQPTKLVVAVAANKKSRYEGLAFDVSTGTLKDRLVSILLDLAVARTA